jgi:hypothetical protein
MYRHHGFWNEHRKRSLYLGFLLLGLALVIQVSAGHYSAKRSLDSSHVGDIFLDNLPVFNLDYVIVQGAIFVVLIGVFVFATHPRQLLFGVKASALFIIIRAFFIDLTHIGVYPANNFDVIGIGSKIYNTVNFSGNFFFSGHTGLPFLMALILWSEKPWRYFFIGVSIFFGASVLLAHVHYSIDVFAAPFITYSIFGLGKRLFPRDYAVLTGGVSSSLRSD